MLYLAELQQKKSGFIGGAKAELRLLAFQRADQSWSSVQGEEVIPAEDANNFSANVLVLADLNANRQVQRIQEAGRPLSGILQNFSRQVEKSKTLEEEIEQWKQSLAFQSQELSRRNLEMETRLEQLEQMEEEFKQLEAQKQTLESGQEEIERLQAEIERNRQELEGAWEHLKGEQRRLEEKQENFQQSTTLDEATAARIQEALKCLVNNVASVDALQEQLKLCFEMLASEQSFLEQHLAKLEQQREGATRAEEEATNLTTALQNGFQEWQQAQNSFEQAITDLKVQTTELHSKQEYAQMLGLHVRNQEYIHQQVYRLVQIYGRVNISQKADVEALENMPIDQLQQLVQNLQKDFQNASRFVNEQEEELKLQQQAIDKLQSKQSQVDENERAYLEKQLAEEQYSYQFLHETLVGQHQNLRERRDTLDQHRAVLWRRQGNGDFNTNSDQNIDLGPILVQTEAQRQQQTEQLHKLEQQISQLQSSVEQSQKAADHQRHEQEIKLQQLQELQQKLLSQTAAASECRGRVDLYQEILQPAQDNLNQMRSKLEAIASVLETMQEKGENQREAIAQMHSLIS